MSETIRSAFAGVVLGNGVSIRQSEVIDRYGKGCTPEEFRALPRNEITQNWEQIPDTELERAQVAHFDAEGFRYYIPALCLSTLRNYDCLSMRVIGTISSLYPKEDGWAYRMGQYQLLNRRQRSALAQFLTHLPKLVSLNDEDAAVAARALRNYWGQFLEV